MKDGMGSDDSWQLSTPIDAVVFDCDGTLTELEGIDELANMNNVGAEVSALTEQAMTYGALTEALYERRLAMTRPTATQCEQLGELYYQHRVHGLDAVLSILQSCNKAVYIVSAGLTPAVTRFMHHMNIEADACMAVDIFFDGKGDYQDFAHDCPLVENDGKYQVVKRLKTLHPNILHIGDGMNDFSTHEIVSRFVGFGGIFFRKTLKQQCEFYLEYPSLLGLLPLALTLDEKNMLSPEMTIFYDQGLAMLQSQLTGDE